MARTQTVTQFNEVSRHGCKTRLRLERAPERHLPFNNNILPDPSVPLNLYYDSHYSHPIVTITAFYISGHITGLSSLIYLTY